MNNSMLQVTSAQNRLPALVAAAGDRASMRFLEFFAIPAHAQAWWASAGVPSIGALQPMHVATWTKPARARSQRRASSKAWPRSVTCLIGLRQFVPVIRPARYAGPGTL